MGESGPVPTVHWVLTLNCDGKTGKGYQLNAKCVGGWAYASDVFIVWHPGYKLSDTPLGHELAHAVMATNGEPPDYDHSTVRFQSLEALANKTIKETCE